MYKNLKIRSTNFDLKVGDVNYNKEEIKKLLKKADEDGVDILSLPELSLTGASLYDGYWDLTYICEKALKDLLEYSKNYKILFTVGFPIKYNKKVYNAIALILDGEILSIYTKKNLGLLEKNVFSNDFPQDTYTNFLDGWYDLNNSYNTVNGLAIDISIGEDELMTVPRSLSNRDNPSQAIEIVLNPTAEAKIALSEEEILNRIRYLSKDVTYVYTSSGIGESSTDFVYNGLNVIANNGKIEAKASNSNVDFVGKYYMDIDEESLFFKEFNNKIIKKEKFPYLPDYEDRDRYVADVLDIGASGLLTRMKHIGIEDVFLGLSGGLDSTMALLTLVHAYRKEGLDLKKIHSYTMPCFGTSDRTKSNAFKLCQALGLELKEIDISQSVSVHLKDIGHDGKTQDTAFENAQARERTQVLFDLANMHKGIVIGTGDLSENMQGFATYNGDQMSNYSLNASLMKSEIRYVVGAIADTTENKELKNVLTDILDTPVSPELTSEKKGQISQKTEDIIGPYELIDYFIYEHLTYHLKASEILEDAISAFSDSYDEQTIKKWLISYFKRFTKSQFKRSASVDGPNITGRSFSPRAGFKIASDMGYKGYLDILNEE